MIIVCLLAFGSLNLTIILLQLITVYRRYKKRDGRRADMLDYFFLNLGMLGQIFIYLVPGFLFFIFLPACLFVLFEGWDYVAAVYYAFVTLTTIGFGDLVAGNIIWMMIEKVVPVLSLILYVYLYLLYYFVKLRRSVGFQAVKVAG